MSDTKLILSIIVMVPFVKNLIKLKLLSKSSETAHDDISVIEFISSLFTAIIFGILITIF